MFLKQDSRIIGDSNHILEFLTVPHTQQALHESVLNNEQPKKKKKGHKSTELEQMRMDLKESKYF